MSQVAGSVVWSHFENRNNLGEALSHWLKHARPIVQVWWRRPVRSLMTPYSPPRVVSEAAFTHKLIIEVSFGVIRSLAG